MTTTPLSGTARSQTESKAEETKEAAKQGVAEVAGTAQEQASALVEATKQQGAEVARDAKEHAQDLMGQTRDQLRAQANDQMRSLAETVHAIAQQLDGLTNGQPQQGMVLDMANQIASSAHRIGDHLDQGGMQAVVGDVKQFARRRPGAFLAASLLGGVVAGRMLRSSDVRDLAQTVKDAATSAGESQSTGPAPLPEPGFQAPGAMGYPGMAE